MATYQDIKGLRVKYLSADPSTLVGGEVWYNSTTGTLKGLVLIPSTTSQTALSRSANFSQGGSFSGGSSDAALVTSGSPGTADPTEEFNGSGWTAGGAMNTARFNSSGFGTLTAGAIVGGLTPTVTNATELYDGTTWTTNPNAAPVAARGYCGGGPQTAGIMYSGHAAPAYPIAVTITQYFDGSSWSVPPATMNTARSNMSGCGTQTAALGVSGESGPTPTAPTTVEEYNGSSWTTVSSLNTARGNQGPAMCQGSTTSAAMLGGNPSPGVAIENWDGTSWTTSPASLVNANSQAAGQGSSSGDILKAGGNAQASCEKYEESINVITPGAWASGGALLTGRYMLGGCGLQTAALAFGGTTPGTGKTETYDGTSWTEVADLSTAREEPGSAGIQTAALAIGGQPGGGATTDTEEWGGSSWTAGGALPSAKKGSGGLGILTAALNAGGVDGPGNGVATSEEYNGTSWTAGEDMPAAKYHFGAAGIQTAGLTFGGSEDKWTTTEEYDGTNWTTAGAMVKGAKGIGASTSGTQTAAIGFSGRNPNVTAITNTEGYDGTAWSTRPAVATAKQYIGGAGTSTAALKTGGGPSPSSYDGVEAFTGETSVETASTLTTS